MRQGLIVSFVAAAMAALALGLFLGIMIGESRGLARAVTDEVTDNPTGHRAGGRFDYRQFDDAVEILHDNVTGRDFMVWYWRDDVEVTPL